jgi:hypothetical protein
MSREIVGDNMNFLCRGLASNDLLEKSHELRAGMAGRSSAQDFTTLGVERGKERKRPVPIIFETVPLCPPWAQGQYRIQPIQCLNGTFLIHTEHRCIDRRLEIQTDDIGGFFLELWIVTGKIAAQSMGAAAQLWPGCALPGRGWCPLRWQSCESTSASIHQSVCVGPVAALWLRVARFPCCDFFHDAGRRGHQGVPQQSALSTIEPY